MPKEGWQDELVLALPSEVILPQSHSGVRPIRDARSFSSLVFENAQFLPRGAVETDPQWKQLIPYQVFNYGRSVALWQMNDQGSEVRLRSAHRLGIGGHIKPEDFAHATNVFDLAVREREEEVTIKAPLGHQRLVGLINDDTTEVGQVHLGVLITLEGTSLDIQAKPDPVTGQTEMDLIGMLPYEAIEAMIKSGDITDRWTIFAAQFLHEQQRMVPLHTAVDLPVKKRSSRPASERPEQLPRRALI